MDLTRGKTTTRPLEEGLCRMYLGGRGADARLLHDMVGPGVDPLGPENVLLISTGPLNGLLGPTTGRVNVAGISPLTGIYGNSNAGAGLGPELKYAGLDRLIITGRAEGLKYLYIDDGDIQVRDAAHLRLRGVLESTHILREECGPDFRVACAGPAAERGLLFGSVIFDLWDAAGRTGMGSIMASKNLKAVVVRGSGGLTVADPERYYEVITDAWEGVLSDPGFRTGEHSALGTCICVNWGNAQGWLPTRNFRECVFESADSISGEEFRDVYSTRDAPLPGGRACMSCPNRCKRFGVVSSGRYAGTRGNIEFEGAAAFGSKTGVGELDAVFHAFMLANDYGMDCITCGNTIAFYMELREQGILTPDDLEGVDLRFGNSEAMVEMVHRIANQDGRLGRLGALGSERAARAIGRGAEAYLNTIKGMETIACDPRSAKGFGFAYAVSTRGSDHLRAHPVFEMLRMPGRVAKEMFGSEDAAHLRKYGGKVRMVVWHEDMGAITDSAGTCRFMHASYYACYPIPEMLARERDTDDVHSIKYHEWLSAATGMEITYEQMMGTAGRIILTERCLNARLGIRREHDRLPRRFLKEAVPGGPARGEVFDEKVFQRMLDEYYELRRVDPRTGIPRREGLLETGMDDILRTMEGEGVIPPLKGGSGRG